MKIVICTLAVLMWIGCGVLDAGWWIARERAAFPKLMQSPREARALQREGMTSVIFGPIAMVVGFLAFDGGIDGWTLTNKPLPCTSDPDIWCKP